MFFWINFFRKVELTKRQQKIALWWLARGRRLVQMKRLIEGIIAAHMEHHCDNCEANSNLHVQEVIPLEELVSEFDKKIKLGIDKLDKMHPVIGWRKFFQQTQIFRTLCSQCLSEAEHFKMEENQQLISDDSELSSLAEKNNKIIIEFDDTSAAIAAMWLLNTRKQIHKKRGPPTVPTLQLGIAQSLTPNDPITEYVFFF